MNTPEKIDIVNAFDRVIDTIERTDDWNKTRPDTHRIVNVFILNTKGEMLAQKRKSNKSLYPNKYDPSVGGMVTANQTYDEAAQKEMREELGLECELKKIGKLIIREHNSHQIHSFNTIYTATTDEQPKGWETEAESIHYFSDKQIDKMIREQPEDFTPAFIEGYKYFLRNV